MRIKILLDNDLATHELKSSTLAWIPRPTFYGICKLRLSALDAVSRGDGFVKSPISALRFISCSLQRT
jgi:hypothetical protein